jgi:NAD(P)-dependent dehydrogenase (short-subunit alcohol dehydrogenase family)
VQPLESRTALVTGAGRGIGRASALAFAAAGARVVVVDIDEDGGKETTALIGDAGGEAAFVAADLTRAADVIAMVDRARSAYGRLDCAHNNAGILGAATTLHRYDDDEWHKVVAVNQTAVYLCMKHEIAAFLADGGPGAIVNTASYSALVGVPFASAYVATKHAVLGLTRAAAVEYGRKGIRVNAVCPGTVRTEMTVERIGDNEKMEQAMYATTPMHRLAEPDEVAAAAVWLCTDAASFVNGHAMAVDGGALAQ